MSSLSLQDNICGPPPPRLSLHCKDREFPSYFDVVPYMNEDHARCTNINLYHDYDYNHDMNHDNVIEINDLIYLLFNGLWDLNPLHICFLAELCDLKFKNLYWGRHCIVRRVSKLLKSQTLPHKMQNANRPSPSSKQHQGSSFCYCSFGIPLFNLPKPRVYKKLRIIFNIKQTTTKPKIFLEYSFIVFDNNKVNL